MGKRKSRAKAVQAREDRRAFLAFLTALFSLVGGLFTMTGAGLNFFTARRARPVSAVGAASGRAIVAGVGESITGTLNVQLEPLRLSATGTVSNPPSPDDLIA